MPHLADYTTKVKVVKIAVNVNAVHAFLETVRTPAETQPPAI